MHLALTWASPFCGSTFNVLRFFGFRLHLPKCKRTRSPGPFAFACSKASSLLGGCFRCSFRCGFLGGFLGLWCCCFLRCCGFCGHGQTLGGSGFALRAAACCLGFALASGCAGLFLDLLALSAHCGLLVCHGSVGLAARIERGRGCWLRTAVGLSTKVRSLCAFGD